GGGRGRPGRAPHAAHGVRPRVDRRERAPRVRRPERVPDAFHKRGAAVSSDRVRFVQSRQALWRNVSGGVLIPRGHHEHSEMLSRTAADVWRLLERPRTLSEVVDGLATRYEGRRDVIARDVETVLRELQTDEFVETVADADD